MAGRLFMMPVPIADGPLANTLPERVVTEARRINHYLAENAKSARAFLKSVEHPLPISEISITEIGHYPDSEKIREYLSPLEAGLDMAVISEAGCPGIADPGAQLAHYAQRQGWTVVPLVGPSSLILALMASGLTGQNFRFCGYLPVKEPDRSNAIRDLEKRSAHDGETQLFIETPYRNNALLGDLVRTLAPNTEILVATDITGASEAIRTRRAADWKKAALDLPKLPTVFGILATSQKKTHRPRVAATRSPRPTRRRA